MANTFYKNIYNLDSLGIISPRPIYIIGYTFYPNAEGDAAQFVYWTEDTSEVSAAATATGVTYTVTVSTDNTVTSTGNFASTWADGKVAKCTKTTGSDWGKYGLIKTGGNDTAFVTHLMPFTTEASKVGDWVQYTTYNAFRGKASKASDTETSMWFPFPGDGFRFPNLALDDIDTSDVVIIYVG